MTQPLLVNLGCGDRFHRDWLNLDMVSCAPEVKACDLRRGIPLDTNTADACYSSHILEHLRPSEATPFLAEQYRVLKPGGTIRVVIPDLETICRNYIQHLDRLRAGETQAEPDYDWTLLELYDQTTRDRPGGEMARRLLAGEVTNRDYAVSRQGPMIDAFFEQAQGNAPASTTQPLMTRLKPGKILAKLRRAAARSSVCLFAGRDALSAYDEGTFRASGEVHRAMYDRFSLSRLLEAVGFESPQVMAADTSAIPQFVQYHLDTNPDGRVVKPDSLFVEARKPAGSA
ncbi:MAG: class I SAM-dependent methyltransferase [Phycisphaerales bacterium JB063]